MSFFFVLSPSTMVMDDFSDYILILLLEEPIRKRQPLSGYNYVIVSRFSCRLFDN